MQSPARGSSTLDRNKTATVAELTDADVADLYKVRRLLELSAVEDLDAVADGDVERVNAACDQLVNVVPSAAAIDDWAAICEPTSRFTRASSRCVRARGCCARSRASAPS